MSSWVDMARAVLITDEGLRYAPYKDSKGLWTIGVGHFIGADLKDLKLSWKVIQCMLQEEIEQCLEELDSIFGEAFDGYSTPRQLALLSMIYNLGRTRFEGFQHMISAIKSNNWELAAKEALDSKWAKDVNPNGDAEGRDERLAYMIKIGKMHPFYESDS